MIIALFFFGLLIGSFLGVVSYRLPRRISFVSGRSKCPNCGHTISGYDNIPLFSYVFLLGKCRNCHEPIPLRDFVIELLTGVTFAFIGLNFVNLFLASILIIIFFIDLENQIIPDNLVFLGLILVICKLIIGNSAVFEYLLAGFISALILLVLNITTNGRGMGLGDVKLAILAGSLVGLKLFLVWLFFSFVAGALVGILLVISKKAKLRQKIAFGPFLITGLALTFLYGNWFVNLIRL